MLMRRYQASGMMYQPSMPDFHAQDALLERVDRPTIACHEAPRPPF